jgi:hypothetical protein
LQEGETKDARKKKENGFITRSNIKTGQMGGKDADDLESLGDMSNAETVFREETGKADEEYEEDDDVSKLSGEDEFDVEDDEDEHTVHGDYEEYSEEEDEDEEMEDYEDGDSAFSTKSGLEDLKRRGRKVRRDSDAAYCSRIEELEKEKRQAEERMAQRVKEMEDALAL